MKTFSYLSIICLYLLATLIPFNLIVGSTNLSFSWASVLTPVLVGQLGLLWILVSLISTKLFFSASIFWILASRVPLVMSCLAFSRRHWATSVVLPMCCMLLFVMHPTGVQAFWYALYWIIPIVCYRFDHVISRALTATFVAHALGSVIWLYTGDIHAAIWMALIPVVFCERMLMVVGMLAMNQIFVIMRNGKKTKLFLYKAGFV
jgi:hypothetical protein